MQIDPGCAIYLLCFCAVLLIVTFVGFAKQKNNKKD